MDPGAEFAGRVEVRAGPCGRAGFTFVGRLREAPQEVAHLSFACAAPADLPASLESPRAQPLDRERWRIQSGGREWVIAPRATFLHRDISRQFFAAVPRRPAPLAKRAFWRLVLAIAASAPGKRWLERRAGRAGSDTPDH